MLLIKELIQYLQKESKQIFIQTHNFPDNDAIASAFSLQYLLSQFNIDTKLIYAGRIERDSLKTMIHELNIDIKHHSFYHLKEENKILLVDGCKGNKNVSNLNGTEIAVIDHHQSKAPDHVEFSDIRPDFGSCSTIIYTYYKELNIKIPSDIATASLIGIKVDTASFNRGVHPKDIEAFNDFHPISNTNLIDSILRNYITKEDLNIYAYLIQNLIFKEEIAFCYLKNGCEPNLLGILADFVLALKEITFVVLYAKNGNKINFSLRSERVDLNAAFLVQQALSGIGFGGGHGNMAGAIIEDLSLFDETDILNRFLKLIDL